MTIVLLYVSRMGFAVHPAPKDCPFALNLRMLPCAGEVGVRRNDPIRFYRFPLIGTLYRRRIELCLGELKGGERALEVGFGSGVALPYVCKLYGEVHGVDPYTSIAGVFRYLQQHGVCAHLRSDSVLRLPYADAMFDTVLLISVLEHLHPQQLSQAFREICRVLKPGGQVVYGVPVHRALMTAAFHLLGCNIHREHFSTEQEVRFAAQEVLQQHALRQLTALGRTVGPLYEVGHFVKAK